MSNDTKTRPQDTDQTPESWKDKTDSAEARLAGQYLTFQLQEEYYGVPILQVREIIGVQNITRVPETEPHLKGVINLRGQVIAVIDLRIKFGMAEKEYDEETCIIIIEEDGQMTGAVVDRVDEVVDLSARQIEPPPKFQSTVDTDFISGMGKAEQQVFILLDTLQVMKAQDQEEKEF